ncbi:MAG: apolipoprotein N-acyltransferase [Elusimicrobiales bacterium]
MKMKKKLTTLMWYPLATSLLIFLSYPKISIFPLAFISLIPYIKGIFEIKEKKEIFIYGLTSGFFVYLFILYWIYPTMRAADVNPFISALSTILLPLILSIEFIIITSLSYQAKTFGTNIFCLIFSSVWVVMDMVKTEITRVLPYFPWFEIAYSQYTNRFLISLASVGQSYALTFVIVLVNVLIATILIEKEKKARIKKLFLAILIITISHLAGYMISHRISNDIINARQSTKVSIIQPSVDLYMKWNKGYEESIKTRLENLVRQAASEKPDLIIWPENALYGWIDDADVYEWLCRNIKESQTFHIVGSVSKKGSKHVSLYLISPQCRFLAEYHKRILVPFGEYVPARKLLSKYISVITTLGEFEKGKDDQKPIPFKNISIASTICYETIFKYLYYPYHNIDIIINITNDGWYLDTSAPYQHFAASVMRAVENRRIFIRAANNGISAFIYPNGVVKKQLSLNRIGVITSEVAVLDIKRPGFFERYWVCILSVIIIFAFLLSLPLKK